MQFLWGKRKILHTIIIICTYLLVADLYRPDALMSYLGNDSAFENHVEGQMTSASLGTLEVSFLPPKLDYNPSLVSSRHAIKLKKGLI